MRVLVVDDDTRLCSVIERGLSEEGYAVDVAHDGGGIVTVSVEQDGDSVKLSVADTGLAIRQSIDEAHSCTIEVESEVEVGTRFTVRLPRA